MYNKNELCKKIIELYPDVGECGIDVNVDYDEEQKAWVVDLKKDHRELRTFLEDGDAALCMEGKQCVSLGIAIAHTISCDLCGEQMPFGASRETDYFVSFCLNCFNYFEGLPEGKIKESIKKFLVGNVV